MHDFSALGLTVIIPLGEGKRIAPTIHSIFLQSVGKMEIYIIYNGVARPIHLDYSDLYNPLEIPLFQVSLLQRGKGNAINEGVKRASYPIVAIVDADCVLAPHAMEVAFQHFLDQTVMAVGGKLKVLEAKSFLEHIQKTEYEKVFSLVRPLMNLMAGDILISGAFGLFRKDSLELLGGFSQDTVGEDMDVILRLQTCLRPRGMKIIYEPKAICYTGVPRRLGRLLHQRDRWQRGLLDSIVRNSILLFNRHYDALGMLTLPYQVFFELLKPFHILLGTLLLCILSSFGFLSWLWIPLGYLTTCFFQTFVSIVVSVKEDNSLAVLRPRRLLPLLFYNALGILLQFPLSFARIYGIVTFHWRKMVW